MMKNGYEKMIGATVKRESEKAVLVNVRYGDEFKKDVWFPKSQIEVREDGIWASSWILDQNRERTASGYVADIETDRIASPELVAACKDVPSCF